MKYRIAHNRSKVPAHVSEFLDELIALQAKHKLAIVPTYEGEASCHDPMIVIPLDADVDTYIHQTLLGE